MWTKRRTVVAAAATVVVVAIAVPLTVIAEESAATVEWGDCADNDVVADTDPGDVPEDLECGEIEVPINHDNPGRTTTVEISRLPHTGDGESAGSVTVIPGGPGGSGTSSLIIAGDTFTKLRKDFDVVGFDPRGHYQDKSMPMEDCTFSGPEFAAPKTKKAFDKVHAKQRAAIENCRDHDPELFDSLSTLADAKDLDAVRQAVGDEKLNAHATSYGGIIAQAYARNFPERVRTMYMDGSGPHVASLPDDEKSYFENREKLFGRFIDWCRSNTDCELSGEDIPATWQRLLAEADASPIPVPDHEGVSFNGHDLQAAAAILTNRDDRWPNLAKAIAEARDGNASIFAELSLVDGRKGFAPARGIPVHCGDGKGYQDYAEYRKGRERGVRLSPNFPEIRINRAMFCVDVDSPVSNPPAPLPGDELPPMLVAGATNEESDSEDLAELVPGSRFLRYEGYSHGMYLKGIQCVIDHADRYFVDGTLPDPDVTCPRE